MKRICVFCGSGPGSRPEYAEAAQAMGLALARRKIALVYGGARVGLMGRLAAAALDAGGEVIGVIPRGLERAEIAFHELSDLRIVETMPERKALMEELSDGFIALPGGIGTCDEFFEVLSRAQLGLHLKPCGLLNTCDFYRPLLAFLAQAEREMFMPSGTVAGIPVEVDPSALLDRLAAGRPPAIDKASWILGSDG